MDIKNIKEKIKQAEDSVSFLHDDGLKKIAFEVVLSSLLRSGYIVDNNLEKESNIKSKPVKKTIKKSGQKTKAQNKETKKSELNLDSEQLKELKVYYEEYARKGQEDSIFTLASFADEKLGKKYFNGIDINYLYNLVISLKPSIKPPAMDQNKINRALTWLASPSRKKLWLNSVGDYTYEISPSGKLHINYESNSPRD